MLYKVPVTFIPLPGQHFSPSYQSCTPTRPRQAACTTRPTWPQAWIFDQTLHQPFHPAHRQNNLQLPSALRDVIDLLDLLPGGEWKERINGARHPRQEWEEKVLCPGFSPEEVSVKVSGGKVLIHARHEDGKGGNSNVRELRRTITIPPRVDVDRLTGTLTDDGILSINAPISSTERPENVQKTTIDGEKDEKCPAKESGVRCAGQMTEGTCAGQSGENEDTCEMVPVESQHRKGVAENTQKNVVSTENTTPERQIDTSPEDKIDATPAPEDQSQTKDEKNMAVTEPEKSRDVEKKHFQIDIDMKAYNPDSIEIKLSDNTLTVVADTTGHVFSKTMYRSFFIPPKVNADLLTSTLNSGGQLVISGPYMNDEEPAGRTIPVNVEQ